VSTHLVSVTPWVCLGADVQVFVLRALLLWQCVCLMFPMLVPERVRIGGEYDDCGKGDAVRVSVGTEHREFAGTGKVFRV
jgi:hypothetical protein